MPAPYAFRPYCGAPPTPGAWLQRWNLDPVLVAALLALLVGYLWLARGKVPAWRQGAFVAGWALTGLALTSPLCALSVALFSARVGQHMLLAALAAPLVALGRPHRLLARALDGRFMSGPAPAAAAFAAMLWLWHAPGPYAATFNGDLAYWTMHVTTFGAAFWLWSALLAPPRALGPFVFATLLTTGQMGLLGALITFAPAPLYAPHLTTTWAWGLTPLQDQALGGAIMWVPAGLIFAAGFGHAFVSTLQAAAARSAARVHA